MSSSQVPLWVPIIVALLGFIGVLGAQVIATWREDRRWQREAQREEVRWDRDRTREKDNRSYQGRQDAYAQIMGAIRWPCGSCGEAPIQRTAYGCGPRHSGPVGSCARKCDRISGSMPKNYLTLNSPTRLLLTFTPDRAS